MFKALVPLALLGSCLGAPAPTLSLSACSTGGVRPQVNWYVIGRGHEVWLSGVGQPEMIANAALPRARAGHLLGYYDDNGRTITVGVRVDQGEMELRKLWATKACPD